MLRSLRRRPRDRGAVAVEFALLLPLLLVLLFGIIAFGFVLSAKIQAEHAAREAARLAAVGVADCDSWKSAVQNRLGQAPEALTMSVGGTQKPGDTITISFTYKTNSAANGVFAGVSALIPGGSVILPDEMQATADTRAEVVKETSCSF